MKTAIFFSFIWISFHVMGQQTTDENSSVDINSSSTNYKLVCIPNPTSDLLLIKTNQEIKTVFCLDGSGKEQRITKLPNNMLSLEEVPSGWLFLHITLSDGTMTKQSVYKL